jgi:pyrophosphate--fructose-6-phosphate 1-phosphotransferase
VIAGIADYLRHRHPGSALLGFLDGPRGILERKFKEITEAELAKFRNTGGFHLLGSGRDKIEKPEQLAAAAASAAALKLDGLVVIGGDDSNTNAAVLAEYFLASGSVCGVVGVPKTIDGDLKNGDVAASFGFDTVCKVYSELIGNIMIDAASARKYWHFVRLMGRAASHVTLECALQTHPNWAFISEEVEAAGTSMVDVARKCADIVAARAAAGKGYGVILIPEGLVEFAGDMSALINAINALMAHADEGAGGVDAHDLAAVAAALPVGPAATFAALPEQFQRELLEDRDPHGNVQVSHIESEKLLIRMVDAELASRKAGGTYAGKFNGIPHFFGYEGRCALPSNFDCSYCHALGAAAGALLGAGKTGLMATAADLHLPATQWRIGGAPLVSMMNMELRHGKDKPVIKKALVELDGAPLAALRACRDAWALNDCFRSPGPIQFRAHEFADVGTITLALEINGGDAVLLAPASADC